MLFFKEVDFQDTPLGQVPKDWQVSQLGDDRVCEDIFYGITAKATDQNTGLRMLRTTDIKNYSADWSKLPFCEITENRNAVDKYVLKKGDIIIARAGTVGVSVLVDRDFDDVIFGSYLIKVKLKSTIIPEFAHYFLQSNLYWKHIQKAQGSTLKNINLPILKELFLPIPPLEEQRVIAGVLGVVDSVIAKADEVIAKTERLKKGLMQTLLTRGIGHKEFKETEIGKIPKTWEVTKLGNKELAEIIMGQSPPSSTYNKEGNGLPFLQGKMEFGEIYPSPILYCSQPIKIAEQNDILMSVRAPVGDVNVAPYRLCIGRGLASIRFNSEKADSWFYFYYLQKIKNFLENIGKGSTFKAITKEDLEDLKIPYPPLFEQKKIAQILSTVDRKLEFERNEKVRLERIKRGLMDLLLTGKIRVKVDCDAVYSG